MASRTPCWHHRSDLPVASARRRLEAALFKRPMVIASQAACRPQPLAHEGRRPAAPGSACHNIIACASSWSRSCRKTPAHLKPPPREAESPLAEPRCAASACIAAFVQQHELLRRDTATQAAHAIARDPGYRLEQDGPGLLPTAPA